MIQPADFYEALRSHGFSFFTGVPDSLLKDFCAFVSDRVAARDHVINANEGSAVALATGYHLATAEMPVVYLQNSGTGNIVNPLLSLADPAVYRIPILFVIGWRGEPGVADEPQHEAQGRVMPELLEILGMSYDVAGPDTGSIVELVARIRDRMTDTGAPHALLVRKGTFVPYASKDSPENGAPTRADAIGVVLHQLGPTDIVVATTGMASREVFAYRSAQGQGHARDFLTVGSMGHCSQIALGVAQRRPGDDVYCLDGDGSMLMHMGSLAIIGTQRPSNLKHIVINNGSHDSVGGQPTAARELDLFQIALACGYRSGEAVNGVSELPEAVERLRASQGPAILEIRVASRAHTDAGRPTLPPIDNKIAFMAGLRT
jgi:phosphonopyruvate decarboxylase